MDMVPVPGYVGLCEARVRWSAGSRGIAGGDRDLSRPEAVLRILVVSNLYPPVAVGGYELRCAGLVDALSDRHEITVLTSTSGQERVTRPDDRVLRTLPFIRTTKGDSLRASRLSVAATRATRDALEQAQPELIFIFNGANVPQAALRVLELTGVPLVWSVGEHWFSGIYRHDQFMRHLYPGERGLRGMWATGMRTLNRHHPDLHLDVSEPTAAAVMWNTEIMRTFVAVPPTTVPVLERVIHPGTRHEELYASLERTPSAVPSIAFVGRVEAEKGPDVAVRAVAELERRYGIITRLIMCGSVEPEMARSIEALARSLGVARGVEMLGFLPAPELGDVLASAHVVLLPYVWEEPFGLVCVEAGLARVPVVASLSGGMPEILRDGQEALFFPKGDVEACAEALARTLKNPAEAARRTDRAFVRAQAFGWTGYVDRVDAFLVEARERLLAGSPTASSRRRLGRRGRFARAGVSQ
jgi:glycosyltransferase involved in cell wall biosynthesis